MARARHLANAPITEAIIDWRAKLRADFAPDAFKPLKESLRSQFPVMEEQRGMQAVLEVKSGGLATSETKDFGVRGFFFRSTDRKEIAQFRIDGFTFNRLAPYTKWTELFPKALELWRTYLQIAKPDVVTRLAVRCVNHIRIPDRDIDFDDYLAAGPKVPPELPQIIGGFLTRVVVMDPPKGIGANVTQALESALDQRFTTIIMDIDVYKVDEWQPDDPGVSETFELLHEFRNRVFFSHITEITAELFE